MNEANSAKLQNFRIDTGNPAFSFADRLARENGWRKSFADRVIVEYFRFIELCADSEEILTPSDEVDQAWHLHLTYSQSYWNDLCKDTLGMPLHHGPTRGGKSEAQKYRAAYNRTLRSYEKRYGHQPPADIWPSADARFASVSDFQRINTAQNFIIPKRRLLTGSIAFFGLSLAYPAYAQEQDTSSILAMFSAAILMLFAWSLLRRFFKKKRRRKKKGDSGCSSVGGCGGCIGNSEGGGDGGGCGGCGG